MTAVLPEADLRHSRASGAVRIGALCLLATSTPALACNASLSKASSDPAISFDPFDGRTASVDLGVTIDRNGAGTCQLALAIAADGAQGGNRVLAGSGPATLHYTVVTPDGVEYPNSLDQPLPISANPNGTTTVTVRFQVPAGQMASAGTFSDQIRVRLLDLQVGKAQKGEVATLVSATVPSRAQVNLAGGAGPFNAGAFAFAGLDFGELAMGAVRRAFVQIRATRPVTISLLSQNAGAMRRTGSSNAAEAIAYTLALDGTTIQLANGRQSMSATPPVSLDGQSLALAVQLTGNPDLLPAGQYRDVVTIEVTPN